MKPVPLLSSAFFAAGIFAAPRPDHGANRVVLRGPSSGGLQGVGRTTFGPRAANQIFLNWGGAVIYPPSGETFGKVKGTFTVPTVTGAPGSAVGIWVGLGADAVPGALVQGGVNIYAGNDGTVSYQAFTEWLPENPINYSPTVFNVSPGDVLDVSVSLTSSTEALLVIQDLTTNQNFQQPFSPSDTSNVAGVLSAEWVVERLSPDALMNYGSVTFSSCSASTNDDTNLDLSGATTISTQGSGSDTSPNNNLLSVASIQDSGTVKITYTGP